MSEKFQDNYKNIINDREFICLSFMRKWYYLHGFYEQKEFSIMEKRGKKENHGIPFPLDLYPGVYKILWVMGFIHFGQNGVLGIAMILIAYF